ncbi:MAG: HAMP domain-containing histidine kinase [Gammaproteobacteria bacterium]|nr:HAMP domain-containing histidine kinase [Gammaproteobacteria bacterium]
MSATPDLSSRSIRGKLGRKMTVQASLIAAVAALGIGLASLVLEQFLVREALQGEAVHYWQLFDMDATFPPPHTDNLKGYLTGPGIIAELPEELQGYGLGYHKMHGQMAHSLLYITEHRGHQLLLLFDGKSVLRLAVFFGVVPLTLILILIYIAAWWVYRESNLVLSPIIWLAHKFDRFDPAHADATLEDLDNIPGDIDWEVEKLVASFRSYATRIQRFVERERAFTRDASHEFRTPLTVIKMAADMLLSEQSLDERDAKYVRRIKGSAQDMEELIDAFLILARETDKEFDDEPLVVREIVEREVQAARLYLQDKPIVVEVREQYPLQLSTARKVLSIVLGNLIRNAVLYTNEGSVTITIKKGSVEIADTGIGMTADQIEKIFQPYFRAVSPDGEQRRGYGVGLTIVKRLSDRFNWQVLVSSELAQGTKVEVLFNETS